MAEFVFPSDPNEICLTLYECPSYVGKCVGYCAFHKAFVTTKQLKKKQCLTKQCNRLIKQTNHEYWKQKELKKKNKVDRKRTEDKLFEKYYKKKPLSKVEKKKGYLLLNLNFNELTENEQTKSKGLKREVVQIGAILLNKELDSIGKFKFYIKPEYGTLIENVTNLTGITFGDVYKAENFTTVFQKLYEWVRDYDIRTFCWGDENYKQLWDEIYVKANSHNEYRSFLETFINFQTGFGKILNAKEDMTLNDAVSLCCLKFKGNRLDAQVKAFNMARLLNKMKDYTDEIENLPKLASYTDTDLSKHFTVEHFHDRDYTSSFKALIEEKQIPAFISNNKNIKIEKTKRRIGIIPKYGLSIFEWMRLSLKFIRVNDMKSIS